jgi:lysophospholipase L1-like esterase
MVNFLTSNRKRSFAFLIYIFILHSLLIGIIIYPNLALRLATKLKLAPANESVIYYIAAMNTMHARVDENTGPNAFIFIGDSLIQGLSVSSIRPVAVNFGIGHDTINGVLKRSLHYKSLRRASSVIISVGINDLRNNSVEQVIAEYAIMLKQLRRISNIFIHELLPIDSKLQGIELKKKISSFNKDLLKLAKSFDNIALLKSSNKFIGINGDLKQSLHLGDGLHLNKDGYEIWIQQLKQQLSAK